MRPGRVTLRFQPQQPIRQSSPILTETCCDKRRNLPRRCCTAHLQARRAQPLAVSFNTDDSATLAPAVDWNKPGELLVSAMAKAPRAGKLDIYRTKVPAVTGQAGCR